jgi:hypothetical protein
MDSASIVFKLKHICSDEYYADSDLFILYRDIIEHKGFIRKTTTDDLYESLCTELDCVFYEARFGDYGDYSEKVYKDCIEVLKKVVQEF